MAEEKKPAIVKVIVARDYWDASENRVRAGTVTEVPVDDAMEGIETGAFTRVPKS